MDPVQPAHATVGDSGDNTRDVDVAVLKVLERFLVAGWYGQREHRAVGKDGAGTASRSRVKALAADDQFVRLQGSASGSKLRARVAPRCSGIYPGCGGVSLPRGWLRLPRRLRCPMDVAVRRWLRTFTDRTFSRRLLRCSRVVVGQCKRADPYRIGPLGVQSADRSNVVPSRRWVPLLRPACSTGRNGGWLGSAGDLAGRRASR